MDLPDKESFRDSIGTITEDGKRAWLYPKKPKGKLYTYRSYLSYFFITFLFSAPFIKVNGHQLLLFNIFERKFSIFGFPFWPQDFYILVFSAIGGIVFITLFTVIFGRIFCGWICPQTIFMEMIFRKIEYLIEGDRNKQKRLDKMPWNAEKIKKRLLKYFVFFVVSFLIANVFLAYLISSDVLLLYVNDGLFNHLRTFISLLIFTGVFYFVFAWFREQVCIIACPYGRLQSVLLDNQSVIVAYDYKRGEKEKGRARFKKREDRVASGKGDCIDCSLCVNVCPTGIDIRNGTQMECVNCTACIDECNSVMERIGFPKGLIRYASIDGIENKTKLKFTARMKGYTAVLLIIFGVLSGMLFLRNNIDAQITKLPGQLFQRKEGGYISNVYTYKIINKTNDTIRNVSYKLLSHKGKIEVVTHKSITLPAENIAEGTLFIELHKSQLKGDKVKVEVGVFCNDKLIDKTNTNFLGPRSFR